MLRPVPGPPDFAGPPSSGPLTVPPTFLQSLLGVGKRHLERSFRSVGEPAQCVGGCLVHYKNGISMGTLQGGSGA